MKSKIFLKEKATHGTALMPVAIHHLSYSSETENYFYLHWHFEFEFLVVLEGAILYTIEDQEYCINAGEGLFIGSNQLHAARSYQKIPCEACVVVFHPNLFGNNNQGATYLKFILPILRGELVFPSLLTYKNDWQRFVLEDLKDIDNLKNSNLVENELLLRAKLFEIWHLCYHNSVAINPRGGEKKNYKVNRMQPVLDYIHSFYKEEVELITLANILPMSKGQFCREFKEIMNMSPIAYVIRVRILESCTLLMETDLKIADIAKNIGFNNISYFNREFMKAVGCSPSKYRNEI